MVSAIGSDNKLASYQFEVIEEGEIPDSAIYRWKLDDVASGTVTDSIGSADGTVNGVSSVSGDYQGGSAGDGDGTDDHILTGTLGDFGSNITTDFALAFTVDNFDEGTDTTDDYAMGLISTGQSGNTRFELLFSTDNKGDVLLILTDASENSYQVATDSGGHIDGNNQVRVLVNKVENSGDDGIEIYVAAKGDTSYTEVASSVRADIDDGLSDGEDFTHDFALFASNDAGTPRRHANTTFDDIIIYADSLDSTQRQADLDEQPAFGS